MPEYRRLSIALKALRDLGPRQLVLYAGYQFGLRSGYYRWRTGENHSEPSAINCRLIELPEPEDLARILGDQVSTLFAEADEIVRGQVRLFGNQPVPLQLSIPEPLAHWTKYETNGWPDESGDIKFIWEPARFEWAYTLARAYHLSGDNRYAKAFWDYTETFLDANPPNLGPNWVSAQEVALRLIALSFTYQVFAKSAQSTQTRINRLSVAIASHAARVPLTLSYARAQNNNHLLVEAAGLYTAGLVLPGHPNSPRWRESGWHWFNRALQSQIANDGTYIQHSTNYHHVMLQAALWVQRIGGEFPAASGQRLAAATGWLSNLIDPISGHVPNLGPNDGAYILPLTICPFADYRPVLQAASLTFLEQLPFPNGPWDEMAVWFGNKGQGFLNKGRLDSPVPLSLIPSDSTVLRNSQNSSWAYLRAVRFTSRPGHADQLHLDLWWRGLNIAQDPGTYLYNALPPWDNTLSATGVHNTISVGARDQMTRAGRFLWLDWAQAELVPQPGKQDGSLGRFVARHNGFRSLGILHQRSVTASGDRLWIIEDSLLPVSDPIRKFLQALLPTTPSHPARLHWLFPDWPWEIEEESRDSRIEIRLKSPMGWISIAVKWLNQWENSASHGIPSHSLVRAGELLTGTAPLSPIRGWVSPTYGKKIPALSFALEVKSPLPLSFVTEWTFPSESNI